MKAPNKIHTITIDRDVAGEVVDVTFTFFVDGVWSNKPWSASEFVPDSKTRKRLDNLIALISEDDGDD